MQPRLLLFLLNDQDVKSYLAACTFLQGNPSVLWGWMVAVETLLEASQLQQCVPCTMLLCSSNSPSKKQWNSFGIKCKEVPALCHWQIHDVKFQTQTVEEKEAWIKALSDCISRAKNKVFDEVNRNLLWGMLIYFHLYLLASPLNNLSPSPLIHNHRWWMHILLNYSIKTIFFICCPVISNLPIKLLQLSGRSHHF